MPARVASPAVKATSRRGALSDVAWCDAIRGSGASSEETAVVLPIKATKKAAASLTFPPAPDCSLDGIVAQLDEQGITFRCGNRQSRTLRRIDSGDAKALI